MELHKRLYKLKPEWKDTKEYFVYDEDQQTWFESDEVSIGDFEQVIPKYDTDYLLDKLSNISNYVQLQINVNNDTQEWYVSFENEALMNATAKTLNETLLKLAIKLAEEKLL